MIGDYLYVFGGAGRKTIERAAIHAGGTLDSFEPVEESTLTVDRGDAGVVRAGNHVIVVGGTSESFQVNDSIEAAPIMADGSIGPVRDRRAPHDDRARVARRRGVRAASCT